MEVLGRLNASRVVRISACRNPLWRIECKTGGGEGFGCLLRTEVDLGSILGTNCMQASGAYLHKPIYCLMLLLFSVQAQLHEELPFGGAHNDLRGHIEVVTSLKGLATKVERVLGRLRNKVKKG